MCRWFIGGEGSRAGWRAEPGSDALGAEVSVQPVEFWGQHGSSELVHIQAKGPSLCPHAVHQSWDIGCSWEGQVALVMQLPSVGPVPGVGLERELAAGNSPCGWR